MNNPKDIEIWRIKVENAGNTFFVNAEHQAQAEQMLADKINWSRMITYTYIRRLGTFDNIKPIICDGSAG